MSQRTEMKNKSFKKYKKPSFQRCEFKKNIDLKHIDKFKYDKIWCAAHTPKSSAMQ